jgi:hypothetical protein
MSHKPVIFILAAMRTWNLLSSDDLYVHLTGYVQIYWTVSRISYMGWSSMKGYNSDWAT